MPRALAPAPSAPGTLGERIRRARVALGLSQTQLAKAVGKPQTSISDYESGTTEPTITTLRELASTLGTTMAALLGEAADPRLELEQTPSGPTLLAGVDVSDLSPESQREIVGVVAYMAALARVREGKAAGAEDGVTPPARSHR